MLAFLSTLYLHPPLTAFPLALLVTAAALEAMHLYKRKIIFNKIGKYTVIIASIFTGLAYLSGYPASESANRTFLVSDEAISWHHTMGRVLLITTFVCSAFAIVESKAKYYVRTFRVLYLIFLIASLLMVLYTGYLGGKLVFEHGAGVYASG